MKLIYFKFLKFFSAWLLLISLYWNMWALKCKLGTRGREEGSRKAVFWSICRCKEWLKVFKPGALRVYRGGFSTKDRGSASPSWDLLRPGGAWVLSPSCFRSLVPRKVWCGVRDIKQHTKKCISFNRRDPI